MSWEIFNDPIFDFEVGLKKCLFYQRINTNFDLTRCYKYQIEIYTYNKSVRNRIIPIVELGTVYIRSIRKLRFLLECRSVFSWPSHIVVR